MGRGMPGEEGTGTKLEDPFADFESVKRDPSKDTLV